MAGKLRQKRGEVEPTGTFSYSEMQARAGEKGGTILNPYPNPNPNPNPNPTPTLTLTLTRQ